MDNDQGLPGINEVQYQPLDIGYRFSSTLIIRSQMCWHSEQYGFDEVIKEMVW